MDTNSTLNQVSENILKFLEIYSMNILELSNKTGISYSTLHKIVHNKSNPTTDTLCTIAKVFNLDIIQLLSRNPISLPTPAPITLPVFHLEDIYKQSKKVIYHTNTYIKNLTSTESFAILKTNFQMVNQTNETLLFFDVIKNNLIHYNNKIVISYFPNHVPQLKRILVDASDIWLEDIENKTPCRKPLIDEKIDYFLFRAMADF